MINSHLILMWNTSDCWSKDVLPLTGPRNAAAFFQWRLLQHLCCRTRVHAHGMSSMSMICRCWLEPQHWSNTHPTMDFASLPLERNVFQKIERAENCSFVKVQLYKGLFVFEIYSLLAAFQWPPGKSGFQVARCIAVYSNTFLYNMKANQDLKKYFLWKNNKVIFLGCFELFSWNCNVNIVNVTKRPPHYSKLNV